MNDLRSAIHAIEKAIPDARLGLPEELFLLIGRLVPLVNVDLWIRDEAGRTLFTWRDDDHFGSGWHLPGGVIRFREKAADRVREVARLELDAEVEFDPCPVHFVESISPHRPNRSHCVSLLFRCRLLTQPPASLRYTDGQPAAGQWAWHEACPAALLEAHEVYRPFLSAPPASLLPPHR